MVSYLGVIETYGHDIATQRSIEMAISVFTDAETDTPCMYDTVLHIKVPRVHSKITPDSNQIKNHHCGESGIVNVRSDACNTQFHFKCYSILEEVQVIRFH